MPDLSASGSEDQRAAWQSRLLPLMSAVLVFGAVFFAAMSIVELRSLYSRREHPPFDFDQSLSALDDVTGQGTDGAEQARFRVLATLEAHALQRRYHQANATILARVWTRQLGFITGMLLALVGAAFILGRLNEPPTRLQAEGQGLKGALETSSPGLVLAVLGTGLMALTIWIPFGVETRDLNVYLRPGQVQLPPPNSRMPVEVGSDTDAEAEIDPVEKREGELFPR